MPNDCKHEERATIVGARCPFCCDPLDTTARRVGRDLVCPGCYESALKLATWYRCVSAKEHEGFLTVGKSYEGLNRGFSPKTGIPILLVLDDRGAINSYPVALFEKRDPPANPAPVSIDLDLPL